MYETYLTLIDGMIFFVASVSLLQGLTSISWGPVESESSQSTRLRLCEILETENKVCVSSTFLFVYVCVCMGNNLVARNLWLWWQAHVASAEGNCGTCACPSLLSAAMPSRLPLSLHRLVKTLRITDPGHTAPQPSPLSPSPLLSYSHST